MISVFEYAHSIINKKYKLGEFDCVQLVVNYFNNFIDVPKKIDRYTIETYPTLYKENPIKAMDMMLKWLQSFLHEIEINKMQSGDIAVLKYKYSLLFLGIIIGNGKTLVVTKRGAESISLKPYTIERMFRCPQLLHS